MTSTTEVRGGQLDDFALVKTCYVGKQGELDTFMNSKLSEDLAEVISSNARQPGRNTIGGACGIKSLQSPCDLILVFGRRKRADAIVAVAAPDGPMPFTRHAIELLASIGQNIEAVVIRDAGALDDIELLALEETEIRELISKSGFNGDEIPLCKCGPACDL